MRHCLITVLLLSLVVAPARSQSGPQIKQGVVAGGGGVSTGGTLRVEGTVGQGVVATSSGGTFSLDGGFDMTFHPVNERPTANGQSVVTDENAPVAVTLSGSDAETPSGGLSFNVTAQPSNGTLSGTAPNLTYTPSGGYSGPDAFKFTVTDMGDGTAPPLTSAEATVSINVVRLPAVSARDARQAEPASGQAQMLFTLTLDRAPSSSPVSVDFDTSALPTGPGAANEGSDYQAKSGTVTFQPGERVQTVAVQILQDNTAEPDETFLLQLSNVSGGHLDDAEAVGTITMQSPAGTVLISELRTFGPGSANAATDEFVEVYNNTDSDIVVSTTDGSSGWGVYAVGAGCDATPALVGVIPNGETIEKRGHFLLTGSAYSLDGYGGTGAAAGDEPLTADIPSNSNVALFKTSNVANISSANRLDAVGFGTQTSNNCALLKEGTNLPALNMNLADLGQHSYFRKQCDFVTGSGCSTPGLPKDTNDNSADFAFADTEGTDAGAGQRLGAPGPENQASPRKNDSVSGHLLDSSKATSAVPNRERKSQVEDPGGSFGTLILRRRFQNNTGGDVTRLRFRVIEMTTYPAPSGTADLRALDSTFEQINNIGDTVTCSQTGLTPTPPCTVTVEGTTVEQPPAQANGGGLNSSMVVTLGSPLSDGDAINVQFRLGVEQAGTFRFLVIVEALP